MSFYLFYNDPLGEHVAVHDVYVADVTLHPGREALRLGVLG